MLQECPLPIPCAWEVSVLHEATFQICLSEVQTKSSQTTLKLHGVNRVTMLWFLRSGTSVLRHLKSDDEQLHRCFWNQTCISNWQLFGCSHCLRTSGKKLAAASWYVYRKINYGMYEGCKKWKDNLGKEQDYLLCYDYWDVITFFIVYIIGSIGYSIQLERG